MEILEAYCEDLGRVVGIYEAQEEYFAQPAGKRHRLQFRCSDAACLAEKNPLVVGVNYDKIAEESDKYQQPHFKSHTKHPHIDACIWIAGDAGRHEANPSADERDARHPRPKATNIVDVFEPRNSDTLLGSTVADVRPPDSRFWRHCAGGRWPSRWSHRNYHHITPGKADRLLVTDGT